MGTYLEFRTTARTMQTAAESNKEVLAKYGLSESVLAHPIRRPVEKRGRLREPGSGDPELGRMNRRRWSRPSAAIVSPMSSDLPVTSVYRLDPGTA